MRFQLVRYFTLASLGMFALVAAALSYFQWQQSGFFNKVQGEQADFFKTVQDGFTKQQGDNSLRDLVAVYEAGNVNVTRLFINVLWKNELSPFMVLASAISADHCRAMPDGTDKEGKPAATPEKKACFSEVGKRIMALPGFKEIDARVAAIMHKSTVYKMKVYDLKGTTIYSSEYKQIGEDKSTNPAFKDATQGKNASGLTHRDKFHAFEGTVTDRDLVASYMPLYAPGTSQIAGVLEVYADATEFVGQIKNTSAKIQMAAVENQKRVEDIAGENQQKVDRTSNMAIAIVVALLAALFVALFLIVRRAQGIITQQDKEREAAQQQLAQSEKLAALGQMVAGVAHQLNTPLAFSHNNVSMALESLKQFEIPLMVANKISDHLKDADSGRLWMDVQRTKATMSAYDPADTDVSMLSHMLGDTLEGIDQMKELVENLRDFTHLDRAKVTDFDINKGLHNVAYIAKSVMPTRVRVVEDFGQIPKLRCNPSQLNQVFLNLINNASQAIEGEGTVTVKSSHEGNHVRIDVTDTGSGIAPDVAPHIFENYFTTKSREEGTGLGLPIAKTIVEEHGGTLTFATEVGKGSTFTVRLPIVEALKMAA